MRAASGRDILDGNTQLIRSVEATVVDEMHRRNRLLDLPQDHAVALLLKAYGEMCRSSINRVPSVYDHSNWNLLARGLSYALRWLLLDCPTGRHLPGRNNAIEEAAATRLIATGAAYARLCSYFVPWSRGMMSAEVDAVERQISFSLKWDIEAAGFRTLVGQRFRFKGTEIKPDILVLDRDNCLVSMIEFKNSLAATTVGEVADRMQEYERGIKQIRRAGELFQANAAQMRTRGIIIPAAGYRASLMFRLPVALPLPYHKDILVFDWHSMRGLGLLPRFLSTKPEGELPPGKNPPAVPYDYEMQVGKWSFKLAGMMLPPNGRGGVAEAETGGQSMKQVRGMKQVWESGS